MAPREAGTEPLWRRLAWFAAIWAAGVLALGIVGVVLRTWLKAA